MTIPNVGSSFRDSRYGTEVYRLTDARRTVNAADTGYLGWCTPDYPSVCPWSSDGSRLLIVHQSYFGLYNGDGGFLRDLPFAINASSEPRWSRRNPHLLYFISGNRLMAWRDTGMITAVREFNEYAFISGKGEGDIAWDRDRIALCGDNREAFIFDIETCERSTSLPLVSNIDSLYISPDGTMFTVTWAGGDIDLFDWRAKHLRRLALSGSHMDICRDQAGDQALVRINSNDNPALEGCQNGIEKVRLADGERKCLVTLDWALAVHISCSDAGTALVETYAPGSPAVPLANEILLVQLDGSGFKPICRHQSDIRGYMSQPLATISRDGKRFIFGSNWGEGDENYKDVYLVNLEPSAPSSPEPAGPEPDRITAIEGRVAVLEEKMSRLHGHRVG